MRFFIYKNSVLATLCSMFGAAFVALAVTSIFSGELGIISGIGVIVGGLGFMCLGGFISTKKAERKRKKEQQTVSAPNASAAQNCGPRAAYAASEVQSKPVNKSILWAGIFFLLSAATEIWAYVSCRFFAQAAPSAFNSETAMLAAMGLLLLIAAFRTKRIQEVSVLYALGFLGLALGSADVLLVNWRNFSYVTNNANTLLQWIGEPLLRAIACFLLALFALFSMRKNRKSLGSIVRCLWIVPVLLLLLAYTKRVADGHILSRFRNMFEPEWIGLDSIPRDILDAVAHLHLVVAALLSGFGFRCICRKPVLVSRQESSSASPQVHYETPQYTAPEPSKPTPQPTASMSRADVEKQIQAYKDLLDCGILTAEECEQKIRELTRGFYGG